MNKFTIGEWHTEKPHGCDYEIWHGKIGDTDRELIAEYMSESNAQAITALPELVEVLKEAFMEYAHPIYIGDPDTLSNLWTKAKQVLAKVQGK